LKEGGEMKLTCKCGHKIAVIYDFKHKDYKTYPKGTVLMFDNNGNIKTAVCPKCSESRGIKENRAGITCHLIPRPCEICLKIFTPTSPAQKYCPDCRKTAYRRNGERYRNMAKARRYRLDRTKVYQ